MRRSNRTFVSALAALTVSLAFASPALAGFGRKADRDSEGGSNAAAAKRSKSKSKGTVRESERGASKPPANERSGGFGRAAAAPRARGRNHSRDRERDVVVVPHTRPAPRYSYRNDDDDGYRYERAPRVHAYYYSPWWTVSPWGYYAYGYTPYWGTPPPPPAPLPQEPAPEPRRLSLALFVGAMASMHGPAATGALALDGERLGFNLRGSGLGLPDPQYGGSDLMPLFSSHVTWSPIALPSARLRLEAGLSGIVAPDFAYYGLDVGASGQVAVAGPLALVASAHLTPFPATMVDVEAGVALQFGTLGVRGGWRAIHLDDRNVNANGGTASFNGPTFSIGAVF